MATATLPLGRLLRDQRWLRRMARALTSDEALAEDMVQETFLAAVRRPPGERPGGARAWLATVLRNKLRSHHRATRRERVSADETEATTPSAEALVEQVRMHRQVAGMVLALAPALRETVVLRYVEDLTSEEIGARLGVAAGTVRWRLKTALDELRARLDAAEGGRGERWRQILLPLVAVSRRTGAGQARRAPTVVSWRAVAVLVVVGGVVLATRSCATDPTTARTAPLAPGPRLAMSGPAARRSTGSIFRPPAQAALEQGGGWFLLSGTVLDVGGGPIPGAQIDAVEAGPGRPEDRGVSVPSDDAGGFAVQVPPGPVWLTITRSGYSSEQRSLYVTSNFEEEVHLAPEGRLGGLVVDGRSGRPVPEAVVGVVEEDGGSPPPDVLTDADGRFLFDRLPPGPYIVVAHRGEQVARSQAPARVGVGEVVDGAVLTLAPGLVLSGRVRDADGLPVADALLHLTGANGVDRDVGRSDGEGSFRAGGLLAGEYDLTVSADAQPAVLRHVVLPAADVVCDLPRGAPVEGLVIDSRGAPVGGAEVLIAAANSLAPRLLASAVTGPDGQFQLREAPVGPVVLAAD
ncbi:MAG TPA: sigma-70 family RNA polymerase sigma factor, partial [Acidimicrobiales bacterium]|nr:sigma-70 family RNA polymerase sigma factor [Acidimicrobiales bacterium]